MKVLVTPNYSSSGPDHHIEDGYLVLDKVVETVYKDGKEITPDVERYYTVSEVKDDSPEAVYLVT